VCFSTSAFGNRNQSALPSPVDGSASSGRETLHPRQHRGNYDAFTSVQS
jgi:hypothetical protein